MNNLNHDAINIFIQNFTDSATIVYRHNNFIDTKIMQDLNIVVSDKLSDAILYDTTKNWLYLIDTALHHGSMNIERIKKLESLLQNNNSKVLYITAYPNKNIFRDYVMDISWNTMAWIESEPSHIIHFNGNITV